MSIGIVSDDDLIKELASYGKTISIQETGSELPTRTEEVILEETILEGTILEPVTRGLIDDIPTRGRKEGDVNVPDSLRQIIGEEAVLNGRSSAIQLAADFGISPSSASAYAVGSTSTKSYNEPKPSIISHINKARQRAIKKASKTLNGALNAITQEKLDFSDPDKLSGIAKDMSVIIKNLENQIDPGVDTSVKSPQFVIFAPQFREERQYDVIKVQE